MLAAPLRLCKADMHVDIVEIPSIPRSVPAGGIRRGIVLAGSPDGLGDDPLRPPCSGSMRGGFRAKGGGMDRDTLEGDLDLILGPKANAEPVGEWDWEPPLGTTVPTASSANEPEEPETADEVDSEASDDEDDEQDD